MKGLCRIVRPTVLFISIVLLSNGAYGQEIKANYDGYVTKVVVNLVIEVSFFTPTMFRFRLSNLEESSYSNYYNIPFVIGHVFPWNEVDVTVSNDGKNTLIVTQKLQLKVNRKSEKLIVIDIESGNQIYPSDGPVYGMFKDGYSLFDSASFFNEKNDNSRYSHWFYNPKTKLYDIYLAEDLLLDKYFIFGPSYTKIYEQFNKLVGAEPMLPKKAYGFFQTQHLACNGTQEKLMSVAHELRKRDIPSDYLIIDFEWGDGCINEKEIPWGSQLDWSENYSKPLSPKRMLDSLKAMNFDVMLIHHNAPNYKNRNGQGWTETVQPQNLWWQKWKEKLDIGVRGTWQDTRRNDITDSRIWTGTQQYLGSDERVLFMGCRKMQAVNPWDFRFSVVPVNNLIGSRRYPFDWTGDCSFNWNELKWQIKAITNSHGPLKGISYISSDGVGENWKIQARWNQFSDFSAISRSHNPKPWAGNIDVKNFQNKIKIEGRDEVVIKETDDNLTHAVSGNGKGSTAEHSIRKHRVERYKLLPYIYSTAYKNYLEGIPVTRPMLLAFPEDYLCFSDTWPYQYMLGENLLVAPVYGDFKTMEVYLPQGHDWIDYWSKEVYKGGGVINYNTEDINKLPLFIKSGSILPKIPKQNWITEGKQDERIILEVYPSSNGSFTLYEDDGKSIDYQKGAFSKTNFNQKLEDNGNLELTISSSQGDFENKLISRTWVVRVLDVLNEYKRVTINGESQICSQVENELEYLNEGLFKEVIIKATLAENIKIVFH